MAPLNVPRPAVVFNFALKNKFCSGTFTRGHVAIAPSAEVQIWRPVTRHIMHVVAARVWRGLSVKLLNEPLKELGRRGNSRTLMEENMCLFRNLAMIWFVIIYLKRLS